jgi:hypothetical protein
VLDDRGVGREVRPLAVEPLEPGVEDGDLDELQVGEVRVVREQAEFAAGVVGVDHLGDGRRPRRVVGAESGRHDGDEHGNQREAGHGDQR